MPPSYHTTQQRCIYYVYTNNAKGGIIMTKESKGRIKITTKVQKWGNSLAVRIPSTVSNQLSIEQGSEVEIEVEAHSLKITPKKKEYTLEELMSQVTPENRHEKVDWENLKGLKHGNGST